MCLSPYLIPNVNYGHRSPINLLLRKDVDNKYMQVPCGHCNECVSARQNDIVQRCEIESRYNHLFFATLTYDDKHLPHVAVDVPVLSSVDISEPVLDFAPVQVVDAPRELLDLYSELDALELQRKAIERATYLIESDRERDLAPVQLAIDHVLDDIQDLRHDLDDVIERQYQDLLSRLPDSVQDMPEPGFSCSEFSSDYPVGYGLDSEDLQYKSVDFAYADIHHLQLLFKRLRNFGTFGDRNWKYLAVSELGKDRGRPHFHVLFFVEKRPDDLDSNLKPKADVLRSLESRLWKDVFKGWSCNVGSRKNPVYEQNFRYAKKWSFGKLYTNFDVHWVDPSKTSSGVQNVSFYVTKYLLKGSARDAGRKAFLALNCADDVFRSVWNMIRCRMVASKGLGLDARFFTLERESEVVEYVPLYEYAHRLIDTLDDLPEDDPGDLPDFDIVKSRNVVVMRSRVLVPNFELVQELRDNLSRDVGKSPGPIYIDDSGKHRPLSHYYQRLGYLYTLRDAVRIVTSWNPDNGRGPATFEDATRGERDLARKLSIISDNGSFDSVATVRRFDPILNAISKEIL